MRASHTAEEVAEFLLVYAAKKGDLLSNKKLQKLLYYAEAWHLAFYNKSLFDEVIEAWIHGPVVPSVYQKYKRYKWEPIKPPRKKLEDFHFDTKTRKLLQEVFAVYGDHSADFLERLVHTEQPWIKARGRATLEDYSNTPIDRNLMKTYYKGVLKQNGKAKDSSHPSS
jgi:uncharacterized phage-associated protein